MEHKAPFLINFGSFFYVHFLLGHPIQEKSVSLMSLSLYKPIDTTFIEESKFALFLFLRFLSVVPLVVLRRANGLGSFKSMPR